MHHANSCGIQFNAKEIGNSSLASSKLTSLQKLKFHVQDSKKSLRYGDCFAGGLALDSRNGGAWNGGASSMSKINFLAEAHNSGLAILQHATFLT